MPILRKIENMKLADMLCIGDRIYKLKNDSTLEMCHGDKGPPPRHDKADYNCYFNDDGRKASCPFLAFEHLGIDTAPLAAYQAEHGENSSVPHEIVYAALRENGFTETEATGLVGDVLVEVLKMPGKSLIISCAVFDDFSFHSIAVADGVAHNLCEFSLADVAISLWRRPI